MKKTKSKKSSNSSKLSASPKSQAKEMKNYLPGRILKWSVNAMG